MLKLLAGFGSSVCEVDTPDYFLETPADAYLKSLKRDFNCNIIRATTLNMMLVELGISPQDVPPVTPKNYFDWVIIEGSFDERKGRIEDAKRIYSFLEEEIMDGRIGFRMFARDKYEIELAESAGIQSIGWREMGKMMDFNRQLADEASGFWRR